MNPEVSLDKERDSSLSFNALFDIRCIIKE